MTVPLFKGKQLENSVVNPSSSLDIKEIPKNVPKKIILIYSSDQVDHLKKSYQPWNFSMLSKGLYEFFHFENIGVVKLNGIGSPHACAVLEDLIFLGAKSVINIGSAGGLSGPGNYLCTGSLRDEGTSYHYKRPETFAYPDRVLTKRLERFLKTQKIEFTPALNWTTDAPYRETRTEIERYKKIGVETVDMEVSGLFTVAEFRKVKIAAAFTVSDLVGDERTMVGYHEHRYNLDRLLDSAVECLREKR